MVGLDKQLSGLFFHLKSQVGSWNFVFSEGKRSGSNPTEVRDYENRS